MNVSSLPPSMAAAGVDFSKAGDILEEAYSDEECETSSSAQLPSMGEKVMSSLDDEGQSEHSEQIKQLKLRRDELERRKRDEARQRDYCQRLNEEVGVTLEVCPKIVVPDTNCFVDSLSDLQRLSALFQVWKFTSFLMLFVNCSFNELFSLYLQNLSHFCSKPFQISFAALLVP